MEKKKMEKVKFLALRLDAVTHKKLKAYALEKGVSIQQIVANAINLILGSGHG